MTAIKTKPKVFADVISGFDTLILPFEILDCCGLAKFQ